VHNGVLPVHLAALQWDASQAAPGLVQLTAASNVPTQSFSIQPQQAFASATGVNRTPGSLNVLLGSPTNSGTSEAAFAIYRSGGLSAALGPMQGAGATTTGLWLMPGITPGNNNYSVQSDTTGNTYIQNAGPSGVVHITNTSSGLMQFIAGGSMLLSAAGTVAFNAPISGNTLSHIPLLLGISTVSVATTGTIDFGVTNASDNPYIKATGTLTGNVILKFTNTSTIYMLDATQASVGSNTLSVTTPATSTPVIIKAPSNGINGALLVVDGTGVIHAITFA